MGLFDFLRRTKTAVPANLQPWQLETARNSYYEMPGYWQTETTNDLYTKLSWVHVAVKTIAQACAGVPLNVYQVDGEEQTDIPNHEFEMLLKRPNPLQSRFEFLEATFSFYRLTGNAYWWINKVTSKPVEIWVIPSSMISPVPDGRLYLSHYEYNTGTSVYKIPVDQIVHFKTFNPVNQFIGQSPLDSLALIGGADIAMQRWNSNLFSRDNAKLPGALAFADQYTDGDWERMKHDIRQGWGGTNRSGPMLMRGVGAGGVQWVSMAMSQKDMDFLNSRAFTKEEIWAALAPGLASMLAINATEANSKTGLAVFNSMAVWPALNAVGEKVTNDLMPLYGDVVAAFDDVRSVDDRMTEIAEQQEYARTHTVNEIRAKYYGDKPLPEVGELLPAQISAVTTAEPYSDMPDSTAEEQVQPQAQSQDLDQPEDEPEEDVEEAKAKWKAKAIKALKRGKSAAVPFDTAAIGQAEQDRIREGLKACKTTDDITNLFDDRAAQLLAALVELKKVL